MSAPTFILGFADYVNGTGAWEGQPHPEVGVPVTDEGWAADRTTGVTISSTQRTTEGWLLWDAALNATRFVPWPLDPGPQPQVAGLEIGVLASLGTSVAGFMTALALAGTSHLQWIRLGLANNLAGAFAVLPIPQPGVPKILFTLINSWTDAEIDAALNAWGDRVSAWGVWNEPSAKDGAAQAVADRLLARARRIKAKLPNALIFAPDMQCGQLGTSWMNAFVRAMVAGGANDLFDRWMGHIIPNVTDRAAIGTLIDTSPALLRALGVTIPLGLGEIGSGETDDLKATFYQEMAPRAAAAGWSMFTVSMLVKLGATSTSKFRLFGACNEDGSATAAWDALDALASGAAA